MKIFVEKSANVPYVLSTGATWIPPYPYGYIVGTRAADGAELDCFVITNKPLAEGSTIEGRPIGLMEQIEDGVEDHNVLVALEGENATMTDEVKQKLLAAFVASSARAIEVGKFFGQAEAEAAIAKALHPSTPPGRSPLSSG